MPDSPYPPTPPPHLKSASIERVLHIPSPYTMPFSGKVFRVAGVDRSNKDDLVSGEGSRLWGGRWNPPGLFRAVYFSLHLETATDEYLAQNRRRNIPDAESTPFVTTSASLRLSAVLNITDPRLPSALGISLDAILREPYGVRRPESFCQAIGRIAFHEGYHGLIVPSVARPQYENIVVFPENLKKGQLSVMQEDKLPTKPATP